MAPPVVPFVRVLYPGSHQKGPVTPNDDVVAIKRAISRAGFFEWDKFSDAYGAKFAMEGVKEFQAANGISPTGIYGEATHKVLAATKCKKKPSEWAFDEFSIKLLTVAKAEMFPATSPNKSLNQARALLETCKKFTGSYLYGGGHKSSFSAYKFNSRLDCSSSTSWALYLNDLLGDSAPHVSGWFEFWGEGGRGRYVTVHANEDHVWIEFTLPEGYYRFDTSPHGDGDRGPRVRRRGRFDSGFTHRHPKGL
jgi:hypothetical protein